MDLLKRDIAPILPEAFGLVDEEAARVLRLNLAARKLVDFDGPHGWTLGAVNTGRLRALPEAAPGVAAGVRVVQPIVELRAPMRLRIADLDTVARGASDPDLTAVRGAAERIARAEDSAIFRGFEPGGIRGILPSSPHAPVLVRAAADWPRAVVHAREQLRAAGISGPYAMALGPAAFDELSAASEDGYPILKRIDGKLIEGPLVWAPALDETAVLLSTRGGDFALTVGQDLAVGYDREDEGAVELFITESFTFRVLEPAAAIELRRER
ncbi:MAG: family 1 encapsulin nanocompartment shell protein [Polyangiaceae bacterium]